MAPTAKRPEAWADSALATRCTLCRGHFGLTSWKHHCRSCGFTFCHACSNFTFPLASTTEPGERHERVCQTCYGTLKVGKADSDAARRDSAELHESQGAVRAVAEKGLAALRAEQLQELLADAQPGWRLASDLDAVGRRPRPHKVYYVCQRDSQKMPGLVGGGGEPMELLLTLSQPNRRNLRMEDELCKLVAELQHPFVLPTTAAFCFLDGDPKDPMAAPALARLAVVRKLFSRGSLRDLLHGVVDPTEAAAIKYPRATEAIAKPGLLSADQIALFGRQLLEAISFLQSFGLAVSCLNAGNVMMLAENCCAISEWELDLLGAVPIDNGLIEGTPDSATFAFGHILYEMAQGGLRLSSNVLPANLPEVPWPVVEQLDGIFNQPIGDKYEPLTVADLLEEPFFARVQLRNGQSRMLSAVPADHKRLRELLDRTGYVPNKNDKPAHAAARRRQKRLHLETKLLRKQRRESKELARVKAEAAHMARQKSYQYYFLEFAADKTLGLELEMEGADASCHHVAVTNVLPDHQAAALGVRLGMSLVSVNGDAIDSCSLDTVFAQLKAARQSAVMLKLEFKELHDAAAEANNFRFDLSQPFGIEFKPVGSRGSVIGAVLKGGQAAHLGLAANWFLVSVAGTNVATKFFGEIVSLLESAKRKEVAKHAKARDELFGAGDLDFGDNSEDGGELLLVFTPPKPEHVSAVAISISKTVEADDSRFVCASCQSLGVEFASSGNGGIIVAGVVKDSQAWKLGIVPNSVVRSLNGKTVDKLQIEKVVTLITEAKKNNTHFEIGLSLSKGAEAVLETLTGRRSEHGAVDAVNAGFAFTSAAPLGIEFKQVDEQNIVVSGLVDGGQGQSFGVDIGSHLLAVEGVQLSSGEIRAMQQLILDAKLSNPTVVIQFDEHPVFMKKKAAAGEHGLQAWLEALNLQTYVQTFEENAVDDIELLSELTGSNLEEMGVSPLDRAVMQSAIAKLKSAPPPVPTVSADVPPAPSANSQPQQQPPSSGVAPAKPHRSAPAPVPAPRAEKKSKAPKKVKAKTKAKQPEPEPARKKSAKASAPFEVDPAQADPWETGSLEDGGSGLFGGDIDPDALFSLCLAAQVDPAPALPPPASAKPKKKKKKAGKLTAFQQAQQKVAGAMRHHEEEEIKERFFDDALFAAGHHVEAGDSGGGSGGGAGSVADSDSLSLFDDTLDDLLFDDDPLPTYMTHRQTSAGATSPPPVLGGGGGGGGLFGGDSESDDDAPGSLFS